MFPSGCVQRKEQKNSSDRQHTPAIVICGGLLAWMYSFKNIKPDHKVTAGVIGFFGSLSDIICSWNFCKKMYRIFPAAVLLVLICELFVWIIRLCGIVNLRPEIRWQTEYYNDGTKRSCGYAERAG